MNNNQHIKDRKITSNVMLNHKTGTKEIRGSSELNNSKLQLDNEKSLVINADIIVGRIKGNPLNYYTEVKKLGAGSYGTVVQVKHNNTGLYRAMKTIKRPKGQIENNDDHIINEIEMLKKMDHPNIVKIFEYFIDRDGYYLITEICDKGELYDKVARKGQLSEIVAAKVMYQIFSAVNYCHANNIVHRDLKLENILINNVDKQGHYNIKIIDFGTAKIYEGSKNENKVIGSSFYIAPEVLRGNYDNKCDLWSCGVIMYMLLSGKPPFYGKDDAEILENVKIGKYSMDLKAFNNVSVEAKKLIKNLLSRKSVKRLSAKDALNHAWFKKMNTQSSSDINPKSVEQALDRMKHSHKSNALQRFVIAYLIHNIPQLGGIREANQIFLFFDVNKDGKISIEEFIKGYQKIFNRKDAKKEIDEIFSVVDNDKNGYIEYEEFVRVAMDTEILLAEEILQFAFNYLDKDASGEISYDELVHVFGIQNDEESKKTLKNIIYKIDKNQNGEISFEEFKIMMQSIIVSKKGQDFI